MTVGFDYKKWVVPLELIAKMAGDIVEKKDIRGPNFAWWKLKSFYSTKVCWVPLQVIILPAHIQPDQSSENALNIKDITYLISP